LTLRVKGESWYPWGAEEFVAVPITVNKREGPEMFTLPALKGHVMEFRYVHSPAMLTVPSDFLEKVQAPLPLPRSAFDSQRSVAMIERSSPLVPLLGVTLVTKVLNTSVTAITLHTHGDRLMIYPPYDRYCGAGRLFHG
jgi:hypothetical protein